MNILSWNLCQGSATPHLEPLVSEHQIDLAFVQEGGAPANWSGAYLGSLIQDRTFGSWLLARTGSLTLLPDFGYHGWLTGGVWSGPYGDIACFSLHSPSTKPSRYVQHCVDMVAHINSEVGPTLPLIIGGDFNFRSLGRRAAGESVQTTTEELTALKDWEALGLSVAWQTANPDRPLPQTLRWSRNRQTPYHCDGFLTRNVSITSCTVIDTTAIEHRSDHDPVFCTAVI